MNTCKGDVSWRETNKLEVTESASGLVKRRALPYKDRGQIVNQRSSAAKMAKHHSDILSEFETQHQAVARKETNPDKDTDVGNTTQIISFPE